MEKMNKLIILQGIPCSGKSVWAKQFVLEDPLYRIRVNRDDIRFMFGKYWVPQRESLVSTIEATCVEEALASGYTVVLDATNLNEKYLNYWKNLARVNNIEIEYKKFYISLEEAIERDKLRIENSVGEKVIKNFFEKYNGKF